MHEVQDGFKCQEIKRVRNIDEARRSRAAMCFQETEDEAQLKQFPRRRLTRNQRGNKKMRASKGFGMPLCTRLTRLDAPQCMCLGAAREGALSASLSKHGLAGFTSWHTQQSAWPWMHTLAQQLAGARLSYTACTNEQHHNGCHWRHCAHCVLLCWQAQQLHLP
eukprot:scaffold106369_cov19-Tisochrysis_lutea.AAC.4